MTRRSSAAGAVTRRLALTLRPDGTLAALGADDDAAPVARDAATDVVRGPLCR